MTTILHSPPSPLPFESNLAFLASAAAVELDGMLHGSDEDLRFASQLGDALRARVPASDTTPAARALLDPIMADLFGRALYRASGSELHSTQEVRTGARAMADRLAAVGPDTESEQLRELRDFCVALSQSAQADLAARRELRPMSRFRK